MLYVIIFLGYLRLNRTKFVWHVSAMYRTQHSYYLDSICTYFALIFQKQ
jgi:hypothetical protein